MLARLAASGHVAGESDMNYGGIDPGEFFSESRAGLASLRAKGYFVRIARRAPVGEKPAAGQKITVLVIEDDPQLVKLLRTYLQMEDFAVRSAATREEINAALREPPKPDLVLLDVVLPDIDGFDVLAKMRQHDLVKDVPVIMATAKATREAVLAGLQHGADGYVTKPYDMDILLKTINTVLGIAK
jgi:CheY-like chemotaxis protein